MKTDGVVLAGLSPHPAILIPEVGRGEEQKASSTVRALEELGQAFAEAKYDTLVIITPHGTMFQGAVSIRAEARLVGSLAAFGAKEIGVSFDNDLDLLSSVASIAKKEMGLSTIRLDRRAARRHGTQPDLDHGVVVPMYFLAKAGFAKRLLVVNVGWLPPKDTYRYGTAIAKGAVALGRSIAVLASGDLSHRLQVGAPAGYSPRGREFDETIMGHIREYNPDGVVEMDDRLRSAAGECGLLPIAMMMGTLHERKVVSQVLSYEGPWGVGYGVALLCPEETKEAKEADNKGDSRQEESFIVRLARRTVEEYVTRGKILSVPQDIPHEFREPRAAFVSIHKGSALRGCIGTVAPTTESAAAEVIQNAISAATEDGRFLPVRSHELGELEYSVDILGEPVPVSGMGELDHKKYGVLVELGLRRGLLLPDLPGVTSVREQLEIAKRKAGIGAREPGVLVKRFTVTRYT